MQIEFCPSAAPTLGIEMELSLVDRETMALRNGASEILAELSAPHGGAHPTAKHELFESIIEVITGVCDTVADARADLSASLALVSAAADARGLDVISVGTHPFSHWSELEVSPDPRYHDLIENIAWPGRRLAICGLHVHVGVPSGAHAVAIVDSLAYHLPLFLALSASSPFWHGLDTGLASARTKVFEGMPTAGLPPKLDGWSDFEGLMATLHNAGVISTIREVWWDVRPHPNFGTVELRMCDAIPTLDEVTAVAALAQCLVVELIDRIDAGEALPVGREWILRENKWLAARHGLETSFIVDDHGRRREAADLIDDLVTRLEPIATRLDCSTELEGVRQIVEHGPSYRRQRQIMAAGGNHRDVVSALTDELPRRLEHDVSWLERFLDGHRDELVAFRRRLHAHPEVSRHEHRTTEAIVERLNAAGLDPRVVSTGTGVVCDIGAGDRTVALRADIDGLAMHDTKDVTYRSKVDGVAHGCGHDLHTTIVLGAGLALAEHGVGRVRLIFEPAEEEVPGGAVDVIADGGLDGVDAIFGFHADPKLDVGTVGVRTGALTSSADLVELRLYGPGGHTARPQLTVDLVALAGRVAAELPGRVDAAATAASLGPLSLVFGSIRAGDAPNVIPTVAELRGSMRSPDPAAADHAPRIIEAELRAIIDSSAPGAAHELVYRRGVPPVVNDARLADVMRVAVNESLGADALLEPPRSAGGDTFAWYLERVPGCYGRLGVHDPARLQHLDLHSGAFDVDEGAIDVGIRVMVAAAQAVLAQPVLDEGHPTP